jgi:membrane-associated protease RseP (regulator of RpoE activity)
MNHQPFEDWLLEEKPINPKQKLELEAHLRVCTYCSALAATGNALHSVKKAAPAVGFTVRFQERLAKQKAVERRRRFWGTIVFISEVQKGSVAAAAGLKAGDVIVQVGRYRVSSLNDFGILLERFPEKGKLRVGVVRNDRVGYAILEF